jgi:pimeloyl-ACP methyl ester carboxylesterase
MIDHPLLTANSEDMSRADWTVAMKDLGAKHGFYRRLGNEHTALSVGNSGTLLVTFENLDHVYDNVPNRLPWGFRFVTERGWSILGLMAHGWTWYRDEDVHDFFDELRDSGYFDQFERVVFYGASMGGYAATVFSAACPGSTVISISPQATLSRDVASWETRYKRAWIRDYSSRYGYGPDMIRSAKHAYLFYDPTAQLDAMHMSLFGGDNVTKFKCRFMGHRIASAMQQMGILAPVIEGCIEGNLTTAEFYDLMRARRRFPRYLKELLAQLDKRQRPYLTAMLCEHYLSNNRGPAFRKALNNAGKELRARNQLLPSQRTLKYDRG